jgi:septum formation protein
MTQLILASASPRRQELIQLFNLPVIIHPSDVDETTPDTWSPVQVVEHLAVRKANAVAAQYKTDAIGATDGIVVGSDTIVVLDGQQLGKPKDRSDAIRMISGLQGRVHEVYSGIACIQLNTGHIEHTYRCTQVKMKSLSLEQIERYVDTGEPMDKAGAYAIQGIGAMFIESISGCYFNVVGLPVEALAEMLKQFGVDLI